MKISNVPFRIESEVIRWYYRRTRRRPTSAPYISGDGFRFLAVHRFEDSHQVAFHPNDVAPNEVIFCDAWHLDHFLRDFAPRITVPFSVISHNGDPNLTDSQIGLLPERLVRIFSQNALVADPRITPLPIGLENKRFHYNGVTTDFDRLRRQNHPKRNRILYAFTVGTNPVVRSAARKALELHPLADGLERINSRTYREIASHYRFVASPPGNGVDCHRTWEALYLRTVPIVLRSTMTQYFFDLGLPLWLVDSYEELANLNEKDLDREYLDRVERFDHPALWMDYWESLILRRE